MRAIRNRRKATRSASGKMAERRFRKFWKIPHSTRISWFDDKALKRLKLGALVGMGKSDRVVLKTARGKQTLRGSWRPFSDAKGKRILLLSKRKIQLPFKMVGRAAETWYYATKEINKAGSHKANTMWRHLHTDAGGKPPLIYADRNGKVDRNSNFVYGRGTYSVTDWIRR